MKSRIEKAEDAQAIILRAAMTYGKWCRKSAGNPDATEKMRRAEKRMHRYAMRLYYHLRVEGK